MPWKYINKEEQRLDLVRQMMAGRISVTELCRRFGISRQTAYKWLKSYQKGRRRGLRDRARRPHHLAGRTSALWLRRLRRWRAGHPSWGGRKLRHEMLRRFGRAGAPSVSAMTRWLKRWGLSRGRARRRRGPCVRRRPLRRARRCHEVWTVDFKGWYYTGDGTRVEPLTIRDLHSRYGLRIALLRTQSLAETRPEFALLFARHGWPRRIRCDNGKPFGAGGFSGLTRLSAWWVKLGIEVEFITRGRPCENGAHEQFHRVYKAEVAAAPAHTMKEQQARSDRWLRHYNEQRPHEGLGMKKPAELFKKNRRKPALPQPGPWRYPAGWERRRVKGNGEIRWRGVHRYVGEAFEGEDVGLKPGGGKKWRVYFGPILVGELREKERGSIRLAKYGRRR
jgi:transposase InsO family protein